MDVGSWDLGFDECALLALLLQPCRQLRADAFAIGENQPTAARFRVRRLRRALRRLPIKTIQPIGSHAIAQQCAPIDRPERQARHLRHARALLVEQIKINLSTFAFLLFTFNLRVTPHARVRAILEPRQPFHASRQIHFSWLVGKDAPAHLQARIEQRGMQCVFTRRQIVGQANVSHCFAVAYA